MSEQARVVVVSAGVSDPSSTRLLADRINTKLADILASNGFDSTASIVELAPMATDIAVALVGGLRSEKLRSATEALAAADVVIVSTPVYKAGLSGLLKSFFDILDDDLLVGKVVMLAATGGSARHAMIVDDHLRPLVAFLRAVAVPTSIYLAPEDWADPALQQRIERAAVEASALLRSGVEQRITGENWNRYQHRFDSTTGTRTEADHDVDFDTQLMRLAAGGR